MNHRIWIAIAVILACVGCKKDADPASAPADPKPAFVVDSLHVTAAVRMDTIEHAPMTFFSLRFSYHFEGRSGALVQLNVFTDSLGLTVNSMPVGPMPVGLRVSEVQMFKEQNQYIGKDSVLVRVGFHGVFWERKGSTDTTYGEFRINDSLWVRPAR